MKTEKTDNYTSSVSTTDQAKNCVLCNVPVDVHGTACGWKNATTLVSDKAIITDIRHPGFGKSIYTWDKE